MEENQSLSEFLFDNSATVPKMLCLGWCSYDTGEAADNLLDDVFFHCEPEELEMIFGFKFDPGDSVISPHELAELLHDYGKFGYVAMISVERFQEQEGVYTSTGASYQDFVYGENMTQLEQGIRLAVKDLTELWSKR